LRWLRAAMQDAPHPWTCRAPVFRPSEDEFADFEAFVSSIEPACVDFGIAKVVPPASWRRPSAPLASTFLMSSPTLQTVDARGHGRYHISHRPCPSVTLERFERMAATAVRREGVGSGSAGEGEAAGVTPSKEAAALFWSGLEKQPSLATVMIAADMNASRFPEPDEQPEWNLRTPKSETRRLRLRPAGSPEAASSARACLRCPDLRVGRPYRPCPPHRRALPDALRRSAPPTDADADARGAPSQRLAGVSTPALRVGQWRALSPLCTEESDLYALSYLHSGRCASTRSTALVGTAPLLLHSIPLLTSTTCTSTTAPPLYTSTTCTCTCTCTCTTTTTTTSLPHAHALVPLHLYNAICDLLSLHSLCTLSHHSARQWLAAPPRHAHLVELVATHAFPQHGAACRQFLRHRSSLLAPQTLATNGAPLCLLTQPQPSPFP